MKTLPARTRPAEDAPRERPKAKPTAAIAQGPSLRAYQDRIRIAITREGLRIEMRRFAQAPDARAGQFATRRVCHRPPHPDRHGTRRCRKPRADCRPYRFRAVSRRPRRLFEPGALQRSRERRAARWLRTDCGKKKLLQMRVPAEVLPLAGRSTALC
ncbi:hypothetical protein [Burkholderia cepacia]|uniref:hypothetical protein n=1 Tax=Burkholderia cepacia TaxID=292 RepID=UPI0018C8CDE8|nr:hypothetical protein [Burkholderia cepacia]